jgi:hypothetical protein
MIRCYNYTIVTSDFLDEMGGFVKYKGVCYYICSFCYDITILDYARILSLWHQ